MSVNRHFAAAVEFRDRVDCTELKKRFEERELTIVDVARDEALDVFGAWTSLAGNGTY